ncbi:hypothetical protein HK100_001096 [Physocladia obscura]|uniref:CKK domain-containing protein n=1 Tax=Physocladia obscura TaxID=109957 RepID=A0AAD5XF37_9FUNG|nr:hypothetical protein HK100_001096 [Physocladia obscura]
MGLVKEGDLIRLSPQPLEEKKINSEKYSSIEAADTANGPDAAIVIDWVSNEILGAAADFTDPFVLIQILATVAPKSVNLSYYSSDHAFSCDNLHSVTVDMLFNGLDSINLTVNESKQDVLSGNIVPIFNIACNLYRWTKENAFNKKALINEQVENLPTQTMEIHAVSTKILDNVTSPTAKNILYKPSEQSFIPVVRWLVRLVRDESDSHDFLGSYNCAEEIMKTSHILESARKNVPEKEIIAALTHGALYTIASKLLFEESNLNTLIDSLYPTQVSGKNDIDWVNAKDGFLDLLLAHKLLGFQESMKSCIGAMIKDNCPFYESIHSNIIEALMHHSIHDIHVNDIVSHINDKFPKHFAVKNYPYDMEEALLLWFKKVAEYFHSVTNNNQINEWYQAACQANELKYLLLDGTAASVVILTYFEELNLEEVSFARDSCRSNWFFIYSLAAKLGIPCPCWKAEEIAEIGEISLSSFEVPFLVFGSELFQWIYLSNKTPILSTGDNIKSESIPKLEEKVTESSESVKESKWLPIDSALFIDQHTTTPDPQSADTTAHVQIVVENIADTFTVSVKSRSVTPTTFAAASILSHETEILYKSFIHQIDQAVDASEEKHLIAEKENAVADFDRESTNIVVATKAVEPSSSSREFEIISIESEIFANATVDEKNIQTVVQTPEVSSRAGMEKVTQIVVESNCVQKIAPKPVVMKKLSQTPQQIITLQTKKGIQLPPKKEKTIVEPCAQPKSTAVPENSAADAWTLSVSASTTARDRKRKLRSLLQKAVVTLPPPHSIPQVAAAESVTLQSAMTENQLLSDSSFPQISHPPTPVASSSPSSAIMTPATAIKSEVPKLPPISMRHEINVSIKSTAFSGSQTSESKAIMPFTVKNSQEYDSDEAEDNRPPSFNISDIVISDLDDSSSSGSNNSAVEDEEIVNCTVARAESIASSSPKRRRQILKKKRIQPQSLAEKQKNSKNRFPSEDDDNDWIAVSSWSAVTRKSLSKRASAAVVRVRTACRKVVRVPVKATSVNNASNKTDIGNNFDSRREEEKEERILKAELQKFKGLVFIPLSDNIDNRSGSSDGESDNTFRVDFDKLPRPTATKQLPRRLSARFKKYPAAKVTMKNDMIQEKIPPSKKVDLHISDNEKGLFEQPTTTSGTDLASTFTLQELPSSPAKPTEQQQNANQIQSGTAPTPPKILKISPYKRTAAGNRQIVQNALTHVCLAGGVNLNLRQEVFERLSNSSWKHHILVLRNSTNHTYSGICAYNPQTQTLDVIHSAVSSSAMNLFRTLPVVGGAPICARDVECYFKYDCGGRRFREVKTGGFGICCDAISLK